MQVWMNHMFLCPCAQSGSTFLTFHKNAGCFLNFSFPQNQPAKSINWEIELILPLCSTYVGLISSGQTEDFI